MLKKKNAKKNYFCIFGFNVKNRKEKQLKIS